MRTALHSWSFRNRFKEDRGFTVFDALDATARMGFTAIEIMAGKADMPPGDFAADDLPYLRRVTRHARQAGVDIVCLSTYNDFAYVKDERWRRANVAYIQKWLERAGELNVPNIRMLTGYYIEGEDRARLESLTRAGLAECIPVAERHGVNMAIENHNSIFFGADEIVRLIREFGSTRLTACPDPSNWGGRDFWLPDGPADVRERVFAGAAELAPFATQSHLKIRGVGRDGTLAGFGDGLERLIAIYRDAGYDGGLAFESIVPEGDLLAPLPGARRVVDEAIARVGKRPPNLQSEDGT